MSKTNYLQAVISDLQRTAGPYRCAKSRRRVKADRGKVTQSVRLLATHRDAMAIASVRIVVP